MYVFYYFSDAPLLSSSHPCQSPFLPVNPFLTFMSLCFVLWPAKYNQSPLCGYGYEAVHWCLHDWLTVTKWDCNYTSFRTHPQPNAQQGMVGPHRLLAGPRLAVARPSLVQASVWQLQMLCLHDCSGPGNILQPFLSSGPPFFLLPLPLCPPSLTLDGMWVLSKTEDSIIISPL